MTATPYDLELPFLVELERHVRRQAQECEQEDASADGRPQRASREPLDAPLTRPTR